jgi:hypothetical protein
VTAENPLQVVFIDSRVPDIQDLLDGLQPGEQAFVIDGASDGIDQIADILAANNLNNLASISIVSHGETGELELGSSFITDGNLAGHSNALAEIGSALAPGGNIQLYGCDVAQGSGGQQFINDFSTYAGVDPFDRIVRGLDPRCSLRAQSPGRRRCRRERIGRCTADVRRSRDQRRGCAVHGAGARKLPGRARGAGHRDLDRRRRPEPDRPCR